MRLPLVFQGFLGALFTAFLLTPSIAVAQWSSDPKVNNLISTAPNDRINPASASDGAGGSIIVMAGQTERHQL